MTSLPPLPLIDGALFIDNSGWVEGMSTCYRKLQYQSLHKRIGATEKPSLNFGSAIHLALEHRYRKYRNQTIGDDYYNEITSTLTTHFADHPPEMEDWRTLNWAMTIIRRYNERYANEEFNLLVDDKSEAMVEMSFALPLYTFGCDGPGPLMNKSIPIIYTGRIDLPISLDGQIFIMDHKTTSMLGDMFWNSIRMSSQQKGYCWAFQQLTGKEVAGYYVNAIRTKEPPQYLTNGSGRGKSSPEQWWQESFNRERFLLKPGELEEWKSNLIDLVEEFFWHYSRGYMPMKTAWCSQYGRCPYYDVCRLAIEDRQLMLSSGAFTNNTWTPLVKPEAQK